MISKQACWPQRGPAPNWFNLVGHDATPAQLASTQSEASRCRSLLKFCGPPVSLNQTKDDWVVAVLAYRRHSEVSRPPSMLQTVCGEVRWHTDTVLLTFDVRQALILFVDFPQSEPAATLHPAQPRRERMNVGRFFDTYILSLFLAFAVVSLLMNDDRIQFDVSVKQWHPAWVLRRLLTFWLFEQRAPAVQHSCSIPMISSIPLAVRWYWKTA